MGFIEQLNLKTMYREYKKVATVKAKLFEKGDEDGFVHRDGIPGAIEDVRRGFQPDLVPYISTLENQYHRGEFGKHYVCIGVKGERWLVEKSIFEATYEVEMSQETKNTAFLDSNHKRFIVVPESVTKQDFFSYTIVDTAAGKEDYGDYWKRSVCETLEEAEANEICEALNKSSQQNKKV